MSYVIRHPEAANPANKFNSSLIVDWNVLK